MALPSGFFSGFFTFTIALSLAAQTYTNSSSSNFPNAIKSFKKVENEPVIIEYTDGRIAELVKKEFLTEFRTPIVLSDNTCAPRRGIKCEFVLPLIGQVYSAIWKEHPNSKGKFLYRISTRTEPDGSTKEEKEHNGISSFLSRTNKNKELFDTIREEITGKKLDSSKTIYEGHIECQTEIAGYLPEKSQRITYWDENFESSNYEISMNYQQSISTNQMWRRYENLSINTSSNQVQIESAKQVYGFIAEFLPMGVTYQIQWSFLAPNLVDPENPLCRMKWDVDFTYIFNQFQSLAKETEIDNMKPEEYKAYKFRPNDEKSFRTQYYLQESNYTYSGLK